MPRQSACHTCASSLYDMMSRFMLVSVLFLQTLFSIKQLGNGQLTESECRSVYSLQVKYQLHFGTGVEMAEHLKNFPSNLCCNSNMCDHFPLIEKGYVLQSCVCQYGRFRLALLHKRLLKGRCCVSPEHLPAH